MTVVASKYIGTCLTNVLYFYANTYTIDPVGKADRITTEVAHSSSSSIVKTYSIKNMASKGSRINFRPNNVTNSAISYCLFFKTFRSNASPC